MQLYEQLTNTKNLLAFSAGIDSSALLFMLLENSIHFDIALVNYGTRADSDREETHAKTLAEKYSIKVHTIRAPQWRSHFESNARRFRYDFFEELISRYRYDTLITAHQLNDQLEWFLMRLTRGAGVSELIGLEPETIRKTKNGESYILTRPLLDKTKDELLTYLERNNHPYFIDESNQNERFERNRFRREFSDPLLSKYHQGIKRSFAYLHQEKERLQDGIKLIFSQHALRVLKLENPKLRAKAADLTLKELGYLLSSDQRSEIDQKDNIVIGGRWAIVYQDQRLYIAPFLTLPMPKIFKELCRVSSLPIKIRSYCYKNGINPRDLMALTL